MPDEKFSPAKSREHSTRGFDEIVVKDPRHGILYLEALYSFQSLDSIRAPVVQKNRLPALDLLAPAEPLTTRTVPYFSDLTLSRAWGVGYNRLLDPLCAVSS